MAATRPVAHKDNYSQFSCIPHHRMGRFQFPKVRAVGRLRQHRKAKLALRVRRTIPANSVNKNAGTGIGTRGNPNDPLAGISISSPNEKPRAGAVASDPNAESSTHTDRDRPPNNPSTLAEDNPLTNRDDIKPIDDRIFGKRKYYAMAINLPNLNSAGGSWIVHFAEKENPNNSANKSGNTATGNSASQGVAAAGVITAPIALVKSDPAYPQEFIEDRTEGTVTLYAIIRANGTVTDIAIIRSLQQVLDENAKKALARWRFRPAEKNGIPIDIEAVIQVPFKASRRKAF